MNPESVLLSLDVSVVYSEKLLFSMMHPKIHL